MALQNINLFLTFYNITQCLQF